MDKPRIPYKKFNPNFHHLKEALKDDDIRFVFLYGGSSSSKSYSCAQAFLIECLKTGSNTMVFKKVGATISESIYKSFQEAARQLNIYHLFSFKINKIQCFNGSYITFKGLDESEKIKGLESYKYVLCEELSDFEEADFKQIRKRLRGKKGQKIVSTFNPISIEHWIKNNIFDKETFTDISTDLFGILKDNETGEVLPKEFSTITRRQINSTREIYNPRTGETERHPPDTIVIKSTYLNNFWIVSSPCGTYGFYDRQTVADFEKDKERDVSYYNIYALGNWGVIRTGGEFFHAFDAAKCVRKIDFNPGNAIHISVDNNVLPYITITIYQFNEASKTLFQIHEICAEDPFNTVSKAGEMTRTWLENIGYEDKLFLYGDSSTRSGNTIDDEKRSFLDKFIEQLEVSFIVEDRVPKSNPSVALSGEFINAIWSGELPYSIQIDEECGKSINDYQNVKKDVNGAILKTRTKNKVTGQSYEEFGHCSDTLRYITVRVFETEYIKFSNRRKRNLFKDNDNMLYFNSSSTIEYKSKVAFVMPDCNGKMMIALIGVHEFADVLDIVFSDEYNEPAILKTMDGNPDLYVFECNKSYFPVIRLLREKGAEVRGVGEHAKIHHRISANEGIVKARFRFRDNYDTDDGYTSFMNNVLDYNGKDNYEAINLLSMAAHYINRTYFSLLTE
jgi:PBSX family phage terminase large subunit